MSKQSAASEEATAVSEGVELLPTVTALDQVTRGEIDVQISTAKRFPRDITRFMKEAESLATLNDDIAGSCFYKLKRKSRDEGEKKIEGPSVRFAEIVASCWGNMRIDARTSNEDDRFVYGQGTAWDLQRNVLVRFETRRRISDRNGRRYSDDMIAVTANAATAIGLRNAVFRVVPKAFWEPIYEKAKAVAVGTEQTLADRRQKMIEYFVQKVGVALSRILAYLGVEGIEGITLQHVEDLRGLATAIKDGDAKIDDVFADAQAKGAAAPLPTGAANKIDALAEKIATVKPDTATTAQPPAPPAVTPTPTPAAPPTAENWMLTDDDKAIDQEIVDRDAKAQKGRAS